MANKKVSQLTSKPSVLTTDLFPIADPSTGQLYKTTISDLGTAIGSGVSSVNGLVGAVVLDTDDIQELVSPTNKWFTDTRARAALSASSPLTYNSGTGAFGIQVANGSQNGYLSSADWTTFNAKQAALSGTGFVKISGTTISYDNSTYALDSAVVKLTGNQTIAGTKTFSDGTYHDYGLLLKHGTSTNASGYTGIAGTSTGLSIGVGTPNYSNLVFSTSAIYTYTFPNATGTLALTSDLSSYLPLSGGTLTGALSGTSISLSSSVTATNFILSGATGSTGLYYGHTDRVVLANYTAGGIDFEVNGGTIVSTLFPSGNFGLGIAVDAGYKLDVNGTARISGALSGTSASFSSTISATGLSIGSAVQWNAMFYTAGASPSYIQMANGSTGAASANGMIVGIDGGGNGVINVRGSFGLTTTVAGIDRYNISSTGIHTITGAATFSSSVTAGNTSSGANINAYVSSYGNNGLFQSFGTDGNLKLQLGALGTNEAFIYTGASNKLSIYTGGSTSMTITSSGNVGIGTTSPATKLHIASTIENIVTNEVLSGGQYAVYRLKNSSYTIDLGVDNTGLYLDGAGGATRFFNGGSERMRITSGGNVLIGTTTDAGEKLRVNGNLRALSLYASDAGLSAGNWIRLGHDDNVGFIDVNRAINSGDLHFRFDNTSRANINRSTGIYMATSDSRLKTNILDSQNVLPLIDKIKVRSYNWIENNAYEPYGLIAQELHEILPEYVYKPKTEGESWGLSKAELVPMLVKAVQELKAELDTLKNK